MHMVNSSYLKELVNFIIVGEDNIGAYRDLTGLYGLDNTPNEFQRHTDSLLKKVPFTNCYIDDLLVALKGTVEGYKALLETLLETLDKTRWQ